MGDRNVLQDIGTNARPIPLLRLKSGTRPTITTIPRPAAVADVFAPDLDKKRPRDNQPITIPPPKRSRIDEQQLIAHREADDKWRTKWSKVFPTLRFYFETDDATSRNLRARVTKMGANVEPFFSNKVTHLINPTFVTKPPVPVSPTNPFTGSRDLASKATAIGIKVWSTNKLADILDRIAPVQNATKDSLSTLLLDEKQNGTRERDPLALRKDYTYFGSQSHYLLVQDATARTRPIMTKEFEKEWPVLFESFLRISSAHQTTLSTDQLRERAWSLYVDRVAYQGETPARTGKVRQETPRLPEAQPYANASGNSVVITSNIASTSNPSPFTQPMGGKVAQISKRVQVLKGNARAYRRPQPDDIFSIPSSVPLQHKSYMSQDQVIHMLQQARKPKHEHVACEIRRANREKVDTRVKAKDQDGSAGYCENCRVRFTDLAQHLQSKKHRKFAQDDDNFGSLDTFLATIARPPNTSTHESEHPPCHDRHTMHAYCELCASEW